MNNNNNNNFHEGTFHLKSLCTGSTSHTAENLASIVIDELQIWTDNKLEHVNSINTDICSTMQKLYEILQATPELEHVFFTLCERTNRLHGSFKEKEIILLRANTIMSS